MMWDGADRESDQEELGRKALKRLTTMREEKKKKKRTSDVQVRRRQGEQNKLAKYSGQDAEHGPEIEALTARTL